MRVDFPGGTQHWTLWTVHWWWYSTFNWRCCVPLGHNDDWPLNYSPRAFNITQYGQSTGNDISHSTGDVQFPWGIIKTDRWTRWQYSPGPQWQLTSPWALSIEEYGQFTCHNYFIANWWNWVPLGHNEVGLPWGHSTLNNRMSTGDNVSGPTGDTEFLWGTMGVNYSPSALNIKQNDIYWWQYFMANWWYWVPLGHNGSVLFPECSQH